MANNMGYSTLLALTALVVPSAAYEYSPTLVAHASTGSVAWVFIIPLGAILFTRSRYPSAPSSAKSHSTFWIHTAIQTLGISLAIANFGIGTYIAIEYHKEMVNAHTIVGTIVFILMFLQPLLGFVHHARFKSLSRTSSLPHPPPCERKTSSSWTVFGLVHRWLGRAVVVLAMINGGLGFRLGTNVPIYSRKGEISYWVIAALVFVVWMAVMFGGYQKRAACAAGKSSQRERTGSEGPVSATSGVGVSPDRDEEKDAEIV